MSIHIEFISLVIPLETVRRCYPGGIEAYRNVCGKAWDRVGEIRDDLLVRESVMNPYDAENLVKEWESWGAKGIVQVDGADTWGGDLCVVDAFSGPTLPCPWLAEDRDGPIYTVSYRHPDGRETPKPKRQPAEPQTRWQFRD